MRILLFTLYFDPDLAANAVLMTKLAHGLAARDHQVAVVTSFPHYHQDHLPPQYRGKLRTRSVEDGIRVHRSYVYPTAPDNRLGRVVNYLSFDLLAGLSGLLMRGDFDVVLAPSPPLTIGLSGWMVSASKRAPFVYSVQDLWPHSLVNEGLLRPGPIFEILKRVERIVYRKATRVTVLSEHVKQNLTGRDVPASKVQVIPNFVDCETIRPLPRQNRFRDHLGLEDDFVVMYAGALAHRYGLEVVLEAAALLADVESLHFVIVGDGPCEAETRAQASQMGLRNVSFAPFQPASDLPLVLASADVALVPCRRRVASFSVPSKVYTTMASARPIIACVESGTGTADTIRQADCGLRVEPEEPRALAEAIRSLYHDRSLCRRYGRQGREYAVEHHSVDTVVERYERLFLSIVDASGEGRRSLAPERGFGT